MQEFQELKLNDPNSRKQRRQLRPLFVIAVASSCVLLACQGCSLLFSLSMRPHVLSGPEGANEIASRIMDWTLPPGFAGKSGATADRFSLACDIAKFEHIRGRGLLVVQRLNWKFVQPPDKRLQAQYWIDQDAPELKKIKITASQTRKLTINGLPGEFQIGQGEDRASTTKYRQVIGYFRGHLDDAILILQYEEGILTDDEVDQFLKSIH